MDLCRGRVVISKAGRDKDTLLAVAAYENGKVYLIDGKDRPLARPKAKNPRHIACTGTVLDESQMASDKSVRENLRELYDNTALKGGI